MIPDEAIEAAAKALAGSPLKLEAAGWTFDYVALAQTALEAAAPHMQATATVADEMVDAVLEHAGTPRRRLFEYPHRGDDSRDMISAAETVVRTILRLNRTQP